MATVGFSSVICFYLFLQKTWRDIPVESWAAYNMTDRQFQEVLFLDVSLQVSFLFASSQITLP